MGAVFIPLLFIVSATIRLCHGALYHRHEDLPTLEFDYIVVGGGNAGAVIANRLSEDPKISVLILEAGPSHEDAAPIKVPLLCATLSPDTQYAWNYTTVPQKALKNRILPYQRGYMLGGSTNINYMAYTRGSKDDYDSLAQIAKDTDWSWDSMMKYWAPRNEKWVPSVNNSKMVGKFAPEYHFTDGALEITLPEYELPLDERVIAVTKELPDFPFNPDLNSGNSIGIGWLQSTIRNGERDSSATAYLSPQHRARKNLAVLVNARAIKLIKTEMSSGLPRFGAVEFVASGTTGNYCMRYNLQHVPLLTIVSHSTSHAGQSPQRDHCVNGSCCFASTTHDFGNW